MDNNMLKKKMKNKGIHEDAHILQNESGDEVDDPENNLDDEREATASEYRLPVSPEQRNWKHLLHPELDLLYMI